MSKSSTFGFGTTSSTSKTKNFDKVTFKVLNATAVSLARKYVIFVVRYAGAVKKIVLRVSIFLSFNFFELFELEACIAFKQLTGGLFSDDV